MHLPYYKPEEIFDDGELEEMKPTAELMAKYLPHDAERVPKRRRRTGKQKENHVEADKDSPKVEPAKSSKSAASSSGASSSSSSSSGSSSSSD